MKTDYLALGDPLRWLMQWYYAQCNEDWEHDYGVKIDTLDNPGWTLHVDLTGTSLEACTWPKTSVERSEDDWWTVWTEDRVFHGACAPFNLAETIDAFRRFVESHGSASTQ